MIEAKEIVDSVESEHTKHPRGDCYDYCHLLIDGSVVFGDVYGNYAFGESDRIKPTSTIFAKRMNHLKKEKRDFYNKVHQMLIDNRIIADNQKCALDYY